ncbi:hypothetical protein GmHk_19G054874 [Glycine max]|nr:hypothetical protein GmHk_19G054874 [Glycine max]
MTIAQFIKHLEIVEKTVQVWHLERREPQVYWFKVEFLLQWQHMKGISWLWKLPLAGNRKCKSILRFTASNFKLSKLLDGISSVHNEAVFIGYLLITIIIDDPVSLETRLNVVVNHYSLFQVPISINYRLLDDQREGVRF